MNEVCVCVFNKFNFLSNFILWKIINLYFVFKKEYRIWNVGSDLLRIKG